ncbi:DUF3108 domain-containing protein [Azonexus sp.]|uniref:DUF3108 domain-containing protein n=1 Tax=Azonexus sp. TaxID=1872668 RepID=UPI0035AE3D6B
MPLALLAALAGSLAFHVAALFGPDIPPFGESAEPVTLQAELKPLPAPPPAPAARPRPRPAAQPAAQPAHPPATPAASPAAVPADSPTADTAVADEAAAAESAPAEAPAVEPVAMERRQPAKGVLRYAILRESPDFQIGRSEHRWEFAEDGSYRLSAVTETTGLLSVFVALHMEYRSEGRLGPRGLQPASFRTLKNGRETKENAHFDWSTASVSLDWNGKVESVSPGAQDMLSLNYQLAYLKNPAGGARIGVASGRRYRTHELDSLGEEEIDTPLGRFRTLHLRAAGDTLTEIWIALDRFRLPVKIRYTDRQGDRYVQVATELGTE